MSFTQKRNKWSETDTNEKFFLVYSIIIFLLKDIKSIPRLCYTFWMLISNSMHYKNWIKRTTEHDVCVKFRRKTTSKTGENCEDIDLQIEVRQPLRTAAVFQVCHGVFLSQSEVGLLPPWSGRMWVGARVWMIDTFGMWLGWPGTLRLHLLRCRRRLGTVTGA